ncbi:MAG: hypothetical protein ABIV26_03960, partial [Candidatus Limnocylindrales bacterium]
KITEQLALTDSVSRDSAAGPFHVSGMLAGKNQSVERDTPADHRSRESRATAGSPVIDPATHRP